MRRPLLSAVLLLSSSLCGAASFQAAQAVLSEGAAPVFDGSRARAGVFWSGPSVPSPRVNLTVNAPSRASLSSARVPAPRAVRRQARSGGYGWNMLASAFVWGLAGAAVGFLIGLAFCAGPALGGAVLVGAASGWIAGAVMAL